MVEIGSTMSGIAQGASATTAQLAWYSVIGLCLFLIAAIVAFLIYRKSFNVDIIIVRNSNGVDFITGLKGKFYIKGKLPNEYRFKIWGAKKRKLLYNEEAIKPENVFSVEDSKTNKIKRLVILSPNKEGFLFPYKFSPKTYEEVREILLSDGITKQLRKTETTVIEGEYGSVDVSWLQGEAAKFREIFDGRGFFDKWGTIIILIGMILVAGALVWAAYKFAAASTNMSAVLDAQMEMTNAILRTINGTGVPSSAGQPINTIIAG